MRKWCRSWLSLTSQKTFPEGPVLRLKEVVPAYCLKVFKNGLIQNNLESSVGNGKIKLANFKPT